MKSRFQIGGMLIYAEGQAKDIHYGDLERVVKMLACMFEVNYDRFLESISSDIITEILMEKQEESDAIAEFERALDDDMADMDEQERDLRI
jgi:hypothetical protein